MTDAQSPLNLQPLAGVVSLLNLSRSQDLTGDVRHQPLISDGAGYRSRLCEPLLSPGTVNATGSREKRLKPKPDSTDGCGRPRRTVNGMPLKAEVHKY